MTYIPDCRTDEVYNEKFLNEKDKEFIKGFDYAAEQAQNFFNNLDIYYDKLEADHGMNLGRFLEDYREMMQECIGHFLEMDRDEMITSMLDWDDE